MSSSEAQRKKAVIFSTPKRIEEWSKLYKDGIVDGDVIMLLENMYHLEAGTVGIIEIRWDSRVNSPVRAVFFDNNFGICDLPRVKFEKIN